MLQDPLFFTFTELLNHFMLPSNFTYYQVLDAAEFGTACITCQVVRNPMRVHKNNPIRVHKNNPIRVHRSNPNVEIKD